MSSAVVTLSEVTETIMGQAPPGADCNKDGKGTVFVKAGEFSETEPLVREWTTNPLKFARKGDVLVCVVGATAGKINLGIDCAIGRSVAAVRPQPARLDTGYLHYFLRTRTERLRGASQGLAQGVITREMLASLEIPLPPLAAQQRIAAILDNADALHRKRKRAIDLLDGLTQSIFLEMFGDPIRNPRGWVERPLADYEDFLTSGSRGWAKYYAATGRGFIRIQNLRGGELATDDMIYVTSPDNAEAKRTTVREGDVLISITADLGRTAVVPKYMDGQAHINQHIALVRTRGIDPTYLAMYLASPAGKVQFDALNRQGVKAGLNFENIRELRILEPPYDMQREYVARKRAVTESSENLRRQRAGLDTLFSSLQHRAFLGQL